MRVGVIPILLFILLIFGKPDKYPINTILCTMKLRHSFLILIAMISVSCNQKYEYPFQDPSLSFKERARDLVSRMTLEQKIAQLNYRAPAIEELGITEYNWWNECLHGVARDGEATVFPQAIALAAMWDREMMFSLAGVISDEARAKHHEFVSRNKRGIYQGLTFWSPNIKKSGYSIAGHERKV